MFFERKTLFGVQRVASLITVWHCGTNENFSIIILVRYLSYGIILVAVRLLFETFFGQSVPLALS